MSHGASKEQLIQNGFEIVREVGDSLGNHFLKLQKPGDDTCLLLRDRADDKYFLIDIYELDKADKFMNQRAME